MSTSRNLTREASLVKGLDGLGDVGSVEGHLVLGTEGIDIGLAPVGDGRVLLVKILFETRKGRQIELGSGQAVAQVAHPITTATTTTAATVATTEAATAASTIATTTAASAVTATAASTVAAAAVTRLVSAKTKGVKEIGLLGNCYMTAVIPWLFVAVFTCCCCCCWCYFLFFLLCLLFADYYLYFCD